LLYKQMNYVTGLAVAGLLGRTDQTHHRLDSTETVNGFETTTNQD